MNASIFPLYIWLAGGAMCLNAAAGIESVGSSSGQFTAHEIKTSAIPTPSPEAIRTRLADSWGYLVVAHRNPSDTDESSVQLDPSLLVVSCERLKVLFLGELRMADQWQGRINLIINPALDEKKRPRLTALYHPDGWSYSLELPKTISTRVLVRALMDTLLLEMANRNAGSQCSEIPFWLVEGMSAQVQSFSLPTLILQPSEQMSGNRVKLEGLDKVRDQLRRHTPLSFQNLSWPTESDVDGEGSELYRSCAQLFLEQLLQFKDGTRLLREMLQQLPRHLNWQTAFLEAFHAHFNYLLDVEKWWGLSAVDFAKSDLAEPLSADTCGKELQDALDVPVRVHFDTNHLPTEAMLTLQEVIAKWAPWDASAAILRCIDELRFLHLRASPEYRPLVDQYLKVLGAYLDTSREARLEWTSGKNHSSMMSVLKSDTVRQLDALDRQRSALHPLPASRGDVPQLSALGHSK